jgi:hypothetical protein
MDTIPTRRRIAALITALALGGTLAACGDRVNTEQSNTGGTGQEDASQSEGVDVGTNPAQEPGQQSGSGGEEPEIEPGTEPSTGGEETP